MACLPQRCQSRTPGTQARSRDVLHFGPDVKLPSIDSPEFDTSLNNSWIYGYLQAAGPVCLRHSPFLSGQGSCMKAWSGRRKLLPWTRRVRNRSSDGVAKKQLLDDIVRSTEVVPEQFLVPGSPACSLGATQGRQRVSPAPRATPTPRAACAARTSERGPREQSSLEREAGLPVGSSTSSESRDTTAFTRFCLRTGSFVPARSYLDENRPRFAHAKTGEIWRLVIPRGT